MKRVSFISVCFVLFGVGLWLYSLMQGDNYDPIHQQDIVVSRSTENPQNEFLLAETAAKPALLITGLEHLPDSFQGTNVDGEWQLDHQGNLIITYQVRLIFDYFLAAIGEEPLQQIEQRIRAYIGHQLPEPAANQANQLLSQYLALLEVLASYQAPDYRTEQGIDNLAVHIQSISELRRSYLSPQVADAFYGDEEAYDRFSLSQLMIMKSNELTDQEKSEQIESLRLQQSYTLQDSLNQSQKLILVKRKTQALVEAGASEEELYASRQSYVGNEAAARLAELDRQRELWNQRMSSWFDLRQEVLSNPQLNDWDKQQQLAQLQQERFSEQELRRVRALESIQDKSQQR